MLFLSFFLIFILFNFYFCLCFIITQILSFSFNFQHYFISKFHTKYIKINLHKKTKAFGLPWLSSFVHQHFSFVIAIFHLYVFFCKLQTYLLKVFFCVSQFFLLCNSIIKHLTFVLYTFFKNS